MLISECKIIGKHIVEISNKSVWNWHTFLSVWLWELGIEDGMILEKIIDLFISENLEKQPR